MLRGLEEQGIILTILSKIIKYKKEYLVFSFCVFFVGDGSFCTKRDWASKHTYYSLGAALLSRRTFSSILIAVLESGRVSRYLSRGVMRLNIFFCILPFPAGPCMYFCLQDFSPVNEPKR